MNRANPAAFFLGFAFAVLLFAVTYPRTYHADFVVLYDDNTSAVYRIIDYAYSHYGRYGFPVDVDRVPRYCMNGRCFRPYWIYFLHDPTILCVSPDGNAYAWWGNEDLNEYFSKCFGGVES